ncbi:hypothetical protein [Lunatibacter salilacus]|uniref:hypothetical protein n=1 Tax=Lunatibacter salilacus TaxID=2483804 RepID=UPI00131C0BC8|nr:hypothetical protein [Lunatibacter salilacus]
MEKLANNGPKFEDLVKSFSPSSKVSDKESTELGGLFGNDVAMKSFGVMDALKAYY